MHLIKYIEEIGYFQNTGNGISSISFTEIYSWMKVTNTKISGWEARQLKKISEAFVIQHQDNYSDTVSPIGTDTISLSDLDKILDKVNSFDKK